MFHPPATLFHDEAYLHLLSLLKLMLLAYQILQQPFALIKSSSLIKLFEVDYLQIST